MGRNRRINAIVRVGYDEGTFFRRVDMLPDDRREGLYRAAICAYHPKALRGESAARISGSIHQEE